MKYVSIVYIFFLFYTIKGEPLNGAKKQNFTGEELKVACVICKFVVQQTDMHIDLSRECPELAELEARRARLKVLKQDPQYLKKLELYQSLKYKADQEQLKPFKFPQDMSYYLVHPRTADNYIDIIDKDKPKKPVDPDDCPPEKPKDCDEPPCEENNKPKGDKKVVIYHEKQKVEEFPSEILIQHQYQQTPPKNNLSFKQVLSSQWESNIKQLSNLSISSSFLQLKMNSHRNHEKEHLNPKSLRRLRREDSHPDPAWDCLYRNVEHLLHFICEQEVSKSYVKYCRPMFERVDVMTESWIYHDSTQEICELAQLCPI